VTRKTRFEKVKLEELKKILPEQIVLPKELIDGNQNHDGNENRQNKGKAKARVQISKPKSRK
jgi:hypothetical protein